MLSDAFQGSHACTYFSLSDPFSTLRKLKQPPESFSDDSKKDSERIIQ